jgi:hypothetical protein
MNFTEWLNENIEYVVYEITINNNTKPIYVGSGTKDRSYVSLSKFKDEYESVDIRYVAFYKNSEDALKKEIELTKKYGLKADGGSLVNQRIGNTPTVELKQKHSDSLKGIKKSDTHKKNIAKAMKGKIKSKETKDKISKSMKENQNAKK